MHQDLIDAQLALAKLRMDCEVSMSQYALRNGLSPGQVIKTAGERYKAEVQKRQTQAAASAQLYYSHLFDDGLTNYRPLAAPAFPPWTSQFAPESFCFDLMWRGWKAPALTRRQKWRAFWTDSYGPA